MSKSSYLRLKGAYMGYNSLGDRLEYRPEARWGNTNYILYGTIYLNKIIWREKTTWHMIHEI